MAPTTAQQGAIVLAGKASYIEFNGIGGDGVNWNSLNWPGCCGLSLGGETDSTSIHHIRVLNGEFKGNKCGSFGLNKGSDIEISGNYLHDDQCNSYSHGLYIGDNLQRVTVAGNIVEGYMDYGIQFYSASCPCVSDSVIRNNIFRNNGSAAYGGSGISVGGSNNQVFNNIVYGNHDSGIRIQYAGARNIQVFNNTVYNNGDYGIYNVNGSSSVIKNNIVWSNKSGTIVSLSGDTLSNNLFTNPSFVNLSGNDFHLTAGSPAIDAGTPITTLTTGFDGEVRPQGLGYDIGAYEYGTASAKPAAPKGLRVLP
jgi:parallel beta-helix repeat protein